MKRALTATAPAFLILLASSATAVAQPLGRPGPPESGFELRIGQFMPAGDSDFWDATGDVFTLAPSDFDDFVFGMTFVRPVSNEIEIGFNADFFRETARSQYRDWVDEDGFPILHDTRLSLTPVTADVRLLPGGRFRLRPGGRRIVKTTFYIGAGVGLVFWDYEEYGDFLDFGFDPPEIFIDGFSDSGVEFEAHALAGVEVPVGRRTNLVIEGRYSWSEAELGGDFSGLAETDLDLGGTSFYGGVSFRF
jgi:hypothetical protein